MKNVLPNNEETRKYLDTLPKVSVAVCWAKWCVRKYPFSGKYRDKAKTVPLVWMYSDFNGETDKYILVSVYNVTSGTTAGWSFNNYMVEDYIRLKNVEQNRRYYEERN